ncbi:MAG: Ig-like domain-containing protein, partial [Lachnospiraceae bacterium]|nr:Ig-like domain-containing protein [Lachnospiraceae bacterium]
FSSIEKDLKIKFTSKKTGKLVTGIRFEVTAKGPKGENFSWVDTDMDGVIYLDNLKPGNYEVKISDVGDYDFPDTATVVKVQDTIVYQVINVIDEAVDMSKVDLAKEDLQGKEVDEGPALTDTVAYVESSSKKTYVSVKKENITDPKNLASAFKFGGFRSVSGDVSLTVGGSQSVTVETNASEGQEIESILWVSDDTAVATVAPAEDSKSATITGVTAGNTTVRATIKINTNTQDDEGNPVKTTTEKTETFNVNVTGSSTPVPATGVEITGGNSVVKGQTLQLKATVVPEGANQTVTWSSSNSDIATVDSTNGIVKGVSAGTTIITAKSADGLEKTIDITVTENAEIVLNVKGPNGADIPATLNMLIGETYQLSSTVSGATDTGVTYASSTNSATVSEAGLITAKTEGTTNITVTTKAKGADGKAVTKTISVSVKADRTKDTTTPLKYTKEGKEYQVYIKKNDKFVEAKWADYYTNTEFFIEGETTYTGWQSLGNNEYYFTADGKKVTGDQVIKGMMYHFASDGALIKGSGVNGIDVSAYQGNINWTSVKNSGISFVIIRCAFRGYTQGGLILDSKYKEYIKGASDAGLKVGIYIFSQAVNDKEAVEEASLCVNLAQGYRISYPIFIDSEYSNRNHNGRADGLSKAQRTSVCKAFCETIKSAGYTPGVYASKSWFKDKLDANQLNGYRIWLAHYCGKTDYTGKYDLWQHSSTGSVSGISGNVDLDISYLGY